MDQLVAFLGVSALVIATPGPDTALTVRNALLGGRHGGVLTALGVATGQAVWTFAASAGVAAVLIASKRVFAAVQLVGAAYLVWLGAQALGAAWNTHRSGSAPAERPLPGLAPSVAFRQGLVSNLGNPKMAVFFTSLLPQFAPDSGITFSALSLLGLTFCALTLAWLSGYALLVDRAGDVLRRPGARRLLEGVSGAVLVALGLRLAIGRP